MSGKTSIRYKDPAVLGQGMVHWTCPSNIALIKYWGKREGQLPMNPSLSLTLDKSLTETRLVYSSSDSGSFQWEFRFEGKRMPSFEPKMENFFRLLTSELPFLGKLRIDIDSSNTFPHSAGIASSASAMGALALCLASLEKIVLEHPPGQYDFFRRSSFLARMGSGSASRSVFGNYVLWGKTQYVEGSSDYEARELENIVHPFFLKIEDAILIVNAEKKKISSSSGHEMMNHHPYSKARYAQANHNLKKLLEALKSGDQGEFVKVVENEALSLHSLMMSSDPSYFLMEPQTINLLGKIRKFRDESGLFMAFTLDAGPNIHLLYHGDDREAVSKFLKTEFREGISEGSVIMDRMGKGPKNLGLT